MIDVLGTTRWVVERARQVRLEPRAVGDLARRLADTSAERPAWRVWPHWWEETPRAANFVLVLDAINFCFWGEPRWRVQYGGRWFDGYWALVAALRRGIDEGWPVMDARFLASASDADVGSLLRGEAQIPLLQERTRILHEVGRVLLEQFGGCFATAIERSAGRAQRLVALVAQSFPSFRDEALYEGRAVHFYKRAQILVSDLVGLYDGSGLGEFDDLDRLTAFADYKLPQLLREEGVLRYSPTLAASVDAGREIPAGDPREIEIRAATVWAVELLRQELARCGRSLRAFEVDWLLWTRAQGRKFAHPYHRTRTIFY